MKKPWEEHLFFIKGYGKHHTGATEGNIHTVNSTGWATGATICKPSKHIMSSYEWQQQKKMAVCNYAATYAILVVWKRLSLLRAACLAHRYDVRSSPSVRVKKGNRSVSAALNKGVIRLHNTRAKNVINHNIYQNQTNGLGLPQIELHNHNSSTYFIAWNLLTESLRISELKKFKMFG